MVERATASGDLGAVDRWYSAHALIGMTSWVYKWFDPGRDNADDIARTMIRLMLGDRVVAEAALAATSGTRTEAVTPTPPGH